jgi:hypothetical protein
MLEENNLAVLEFLTLSSREVPNGTSLAFDQISLSKTQELFFIISTHKILEINVKRISRSTASGSRPERVNCAKTNMIRIVGSTPTSTSHARDPLPH